MKYILATMLCLAAGAILHAQTSGTVMAIGNIITVKGYGPGFDGNYDVAKLSSDSCVSGDCTDGKGRKILASVNAGSPRIRIMEGKFKRKVYLGDGVMLIDGEGPRYDGTYELQKFKTNYTHNTLGCKASFHPKGSSEAVEGFFDGYLDNGIGKADVKYQQFVVCSFRPDEYDAPGWVHTVYRPWFETWLKSRDSDPDFVAAQAQSKAEIRAKYGDQSGAKDKCSCCNGKGTIVSESFNHAMGSGVNYKKYETVTCNCCRGTGRAADQTEFKANTDGGAKLDYKH